MSDLDDRDDELQKLIAKYEITQAFDPYRYVPPGPVAEAFIKSDSLTSFIMGPVGGGKTVVCAFKRIVSATLMPPCRLRDGTLVHRDRWIVLRSTYRDAEKTVLQSWQQWFPKGYPGSTWAGGNDRPVVHTLRFRTNDGRIVEAITEFIGLNGMTIEAKLRGIEASGFWLNEADTIDESSLRWCEQRTGRYPRRDDLLDRNAPRTRRVIGDFNAPDVDNWIYRRFVENKSENRLLFPQPSGTSADAENIDALETNYYQQMIDDNEDWFVRRFVHNEFGYSRAGKPVYETFRMNVHVASAPLAFDPKAELLIGMDGGGGTLRPAAIFGQLHSGWQLRILGELVPGHGVGPERFGEMVAQYIETNYPAAGRLRAWSDPAAEHGADKEGGQLAWQEMVGYLTGVHILTPFGGSNEIALRTDAVKQELKTDGASPFMLISPSCKILIRGFASGYRFRKKPETATVQYDDKPDKNDYSHPHDALQYLVGGVRGRRAIVRGGAGRQRGYRGEDAGGQGGPSPWSSGASSAARGKSKFDVHGL